MKRKDPGPSGRGKSLISTRQSQQQQRKLHNSKSLLPRSYSSPATQNEPERMSPQAQHKSYVMRSFSTPESKQLDYRRNSDSFYRPKLHGSRGELDSDLENFEQFEDCFLDIDADQDVSLGQYRSSPERDEPRKVVTTLLPGSGLQKISLRPLSASTSQTLHSAREVMKNLQKDDTKGPNRLNFRPLVLKMPARHLLYSEHEPTSPSIEELQASPQLELESSELDRELDNAEQLLDKGVAIATEESDADTVSVPK